MICEQLIFKATKYFTFPQESFEDQLGQPIDYQHMISYDVYYFRGLFRNTQVLIFPFSKLPQWRLYIGDTYVIILYNL